MLHVLLHYETDIFIRVEIDVTSDEQRARLLLRYHRCATLFLSSRWHITPTRAPAEKQEGERFLVFSAKTLWISKLCFAQCPGSFEGIRPYPFPRHRSVVHGPMAASLDSPTEDLGLNPVYVCGTLG